MKDADKRIYERYTSTSVLLDKAQLSNVLRENALRFMSWYGEYLPKSKSATILDIGCGFGKNVFALLESQYTEVTGVDISSEQVEVAKSELDLGGRIKCGNALEFLLQDDRTYDCILLIDVLEHLDLSDALKLGELIVARLKSGGILVLQVPNGLAPLSPLSWGDITHTRCFTSDSLAQYLRLIGFANSVVFELPPAGNGFKEFVRRIMWHSLFKPALRMFMRLIHGGSFGGIYTANLAAVATKCDYTIGKYK